MLGIELKIYCLYNLNCLKFKFKKNLEVMEDYFKYLKGFFICEIICFLNIVNI